MLKLGVLAAAFIGLSFPATALPAMASPRIPAAECTGHAGYDRDFDLPGYLIDSKSYGGKVCVPFTVTATRPPAGYRGDYYVDEFTVDKLRANWDRCKADEACAAPVRALMEKRKPPSRDNIKDPKLLYAMGRPLDVDAPGDIDLKELRRPAFFAQAPWREPIAEDESRTYTVEFTTPPEPFEGSQMNRSQPVKVRGWYLQGAGISEHGAPKRRALILMSFGGGGRVFAFEDPESREYHVDPVTGRSVDNHFPNEKSGTTGARHWHLLIHRLNQAGFDILAYDRRGVGGSGGFSDTNTVQQARDVLQMIQNLANGEGLRVLTPSGSTLGGLAAAHAVLGGAPSDLPIMLFGNSRGTMVSMRAMMRNFDKTCEYDMPVVTCGPPAGLSNIKGLMQMADYSAGIGYITSPNDPMDTLRPLFEPATELEKSISFFPNSAEFASIPKWPALMIARGTYDNAESLEGAIAAYDRVHGLKELIVVRGPHSYETWPEVEKARVTDRMIAFAKAAVFGDKTVPGERKWSNMKDLVGTTLDVWEPSSEPRR